MPEAERISYCGSLNENGAKVRAFLRIIRMREETIGQKGYETLFGGEPLLN